MRRTKTILSAGILMVSVLIGFRSASAATLPPGFSDNLVANLGGPTAIAFMPDTTMLVTAQGGTLRAVVGGVLQGTAVINLSSKVCSNSERGLLGVAVDPNFASNRYVFLYYTFNKFNDPNCPFNSGTSPVNRVSRFTMNTGSLTLDPTSETVLIDNINSPNGNHNAGDLQFGKDGLLYVTAGDGGCDYAGNSGCGGLNDASRDRNVLIGKVLRIDHNGSIPAGNPFTGAGTARCNVTGSTTAGQICQETFAWGLRNPFRLAFDPNNAGTVFNINDVGQDTWEEIDLGTSGADYGWNVREGFCANGSTTNCGPPPAGMTNPIFAYGHTGGCGAITGGTFVPAGVWPAPYDQSYLFSDYNCGKIFRLVFSGGTYSSADFVTGLGASSAVDLVFGPFGATKALFYTTYAGGGQVRRISFASTNSPPTAAISANKTSGPLPLAVNFDGSASTDPDPGDSITAYNWTFGDGATAQTGTPTTSHTYTVAGTYTASLTVTDTHAATSGPASLTIQAGNTAPTPTITSPASSLLFAVNQTITLTGSATDAEDGTLPASSLSWNVLRHHADHTHPWFGPTTGNNLTFPAPAPEDMAATTNSYLEIYLTATDSKGLSTTIQRNIFPHTVSITFATNPVGRLVTVNGQTLTGPTTITSWEAWGLAVNVPKQSGWKWLSWSDGGAKAHTITTPASAATYTATFKAAGPRP